MFLSCVFINFIFVFLTSGQDCNSGMQKRIHFRTDMEHNICWPANNSDVSLGYQFCKNITFILYIKYNVRYNNIFSIFLLLFCWTLYFLSVCYCSVGHYIFNLSVTVLLDIIFSIFLLLFCWTLYFLSFCYCSVGHYIFYPSIYGT